MTLGTLNDERGGHSWGWYAPEPDKLVKATGLMGFHARVMSSHRLAMGHTRFATIGAHTVENAHPFRFGKVVGAHNGSIWNHQRVAAEHGWDHSVDSMTLVRAVAEGKEVSKLSGYGTLEYFNAEESGLLLSKMTGGADLSVVKTKYGVVWSSDSEHLTIALRAAGLTADTWYKLDVGEVVRALDGKLFETKYKLSINEESLEERYWWRSADNFIPRKYGRGVNDGVEMATNWECCICLAPLSVDEVDWEKGYVEDEIYCATCAKWAAEDEEEEAKTSCQG